MFLINPVPVGKEILLTFCFHIKIFSTEHVKRKITPVSSMDNPEIEIAFLQCLVRKMEPFENIQGLWGQSQGRAVLPGPHVAFLKRYGIRNELPTVKVSVSDNHEGSFSPVLLT